MKQLLTAIAFVCLVACNTGDADKTKTGDSTGTSTATGSYPYPIMYSSKFEMGDSKKSETVLAIWKHFDDATLGNSKAMFADSLTMEFPGMMSRGTTDSMIAQMEGYRNSFASIKSTVDAIISTKSTDKNEDWVLVWGNETKTDKKGKTDSVRIHEIWRFNKDSKIDYMAQFIQPYPAKP